LKIPRGQGEKLKAEPLFAPKGDLKKRGGIKRDSHGKALARIGGKGTTKQTWEETQV